MLNYVHLIIYKKLSDAITNHSSQYLHKTLDENEYVYGKFDELIFMLSGHLCLGFDCYYDVKYFVKVEIKEKYYLFSNLYVEKTREQLSNVFPFVITSIIEKYL